MPFITQERRRAIAKHTLSEWQPGDHCYVYYKRMVDTWKKNPSWTTASDIYLLVAGAPARELAWQVFFQLYVMPYELKKREENGDI